MSQGHLTEASYKSMGGSSSLYVTILTSWVTIDICSVFNFPRDLM